MVDNVGEEVQTNQDSSPAADTFLQKDSAAPKKRTTKESKAWVETDPREVEKYGMTITYTAMAPDTPEQWEEYVEKNLKKHKVLETDGAQMAIKQMQINRKDYRKKMDELDKHVEIVQKRLSADPFNNNHKAQLQNLYKIKAVGKILKDTGILAESSYVSKVLSAPVSK